jgi:cytochrome c biogenesis protein CcmG/thiol:disulfide interchange protein DsbE
MTNMLPENAAAPKAQPRWGVILVWIGVLGLLALVGAGLIRTQQGPVGVGSKPAPFTLRTFEGAEINTADLIGQVVVINFWASWCEPCKQEAAELEQAYQQYKDQGVAFLGVNYVDTEPEAREYLAEFGITYPNGPDLGTRISQAFRIRGVPETYILGPQGILAEVKIGPYTSLDEITRSIEAARTSQP